MWRCSICVFETVTDDVVVKVKSKRGDCVCLRCYVRETGNELPPMHKRLRREINEELTLLMQNMAW